jgi:hypothetical protein
MSDLETRERAAFAEVDAALRSAPLAPLPPAFSPTVLARVRALAPAPRFHLTWLDIAIPLFLSGTVAVLVLVWRALPPHVTQQFLVRAQIQWLLLSQQMGQPALSLVIGLSLGLPLAAILTAALLFSPARPLLKR